MSNKDIIVQVSNGSCRSETCWLRDNHSSLHIYLKNYRKEISLCIECFNKNVSHASALSSYINPEELEPIEYLEVWHLINTRCPSL